MHLKLGHGFSKCLERTIMIWHQIQAEHHLPPGPTWMARPPSSQLLHSTAHQLRKLHANITWAQMKFNPSRSRSISIVKGKLTEQNTPNLLVSELPVKSTHMTPGYTNPEGKNGGCSGTATRGGSRCTTGVAQSK